RADLVDGHVHVAQRARVDAVVGAKRTLDRVGPPVLGGTGLRLRHLAPGPQARTAGAVPQPALERAAQRGAGIRARAVVLVVFGPFVVAAGHAVEHVRRDRLHVAARAHEQVLDYRGQGVAGTRAGRALVQHRTHVRRVAHVGRRRGHAGLELPVAQVDRVRADIEDAAGALARGRR